MAERPLKVVFDDLVFDRLEPDVEAVELLKALIFDGRIVVLMPFVFRNELLARFGAMPDWLPIRVIPDATNDDADVLVSDDPARRKRAELSGQFEALTYDEFSELLKLVQLKSQVF